MESILIKIYSVVWGPFTIFLIILSGIFLSFRIKFVQIKKLPLILHNTIYQLFKKKNMKNENAITPSQSVMTALAGTIGIGSLAGVSTAICLGGPGAIFWMWICGIFGMGIKFCEIYLSVLYREKDRSGHFLGGPMYYIKNGLGNRFLSIIFSVACLFSCLGMGNAVQVNSIANVLFETIHLEPIFSGIFIAIIVGMVIFGGVKKIAIVNERIVPVMTLFYLSCCFVVLFVFRENILSAFISIFKNAFGMEKVLGGVSGFTLSKVLSSGISKGIFINEAGLGTASIAHGATLETSAEKEGCLGVFEVFVTSFLISTFSALAILACGIWNQSDSFGIVLTVRSFNAAIPYLGSFCITVSTIFFGLSTIFGWAYYGEVALNFLTRSPLRRLFPLFYLFVIIISSVCSVKSVWLFSEIVNFFMVFPNLIAIIYLSKIIKINIRKLKKER